VTRHGGVFPSWIYLICHDRFRKRKKKKKKKKKRSSTHPPFPGNALTDRTPGAGSPDAPPRRRDPHGSETSIDGLNLDDFSSSASEDGGRVADDRDGLDAPDPDSPATPLRAGSPRGDSPPRGDSSPRGPPPQRPAGGGGGGGGGPSAAASEDVAAEDPVETTRRRQFVLKAVLYVLLAIDAVIALVMLVDAASPITGLVGTGRRGGGLPATLEESPYYMLRGTAAGVAVAAREAAEVAAGNTSAVAAESPSGGSVWAVFGVLLLQMINVYGAVAARADNVNRFTLYTIMLTATLVTMVLRIDTPLTLARCVLDVALAVVAIACRNGMMAKWHLNSVSY
jgi:hypothetical protein